MGLTGTRWGPLLGVGGAPRTGEGEDEPRQERCHQPGPGGVLEEVGAVPQSDIRRLEEPVKDLHGHQGQHGAGHALPGVQPLPPGQGEAGSQPQPQGAAGVPTDGGEGPGVEAQPGGVGAPFGSQADGPAAEGGEG